MISPSSVENDRAPDGQCSIMWTTWVRTAESSVAPELASFHTSVTRLTQNPALEHNDRSSWTTMPVPGYCCARSA